MRSTCPACKDPIYVCNENPEANHYELVVDKSGSVIGETEGIIGDKKRRGIKG